MMMKKLFAGILAAAMVFSMTTTAFAAEVDSGKGGNASITITLPTDETAPTGTTTYKIYKVFEATSDGSSDAIAYTLVDGKTAPLTATDELSKFDVDSAGNVQFYSRATTDAEYAVDTTTKDLSSGMIEAIAAYVGDSDLVYTAEVAEGETDVTVTGLEYGYYYITTSTGTVVTVDSTNPKADVQDKNIVPTPPEKIISGVDTGSFDEKGKNAIAQVGTSVTFTATITKVKGATNYVFHDTMSEGLKYNNDVEVTVPEGSGTPVYDDTVASGETITLTFDNDWLAGLKDNTDITITYSATVTSDALTVDAANNTATLGYGNSHTTKSDSVNVYNAKFTVTKSDGDGKALAGAGFIVKSGNLFYKLANNIVTWVSDSADATEKVSDSNGAVPAFTGLADGEYVLVEKTVPVGYNKAADLTFTIEAGDYTASNLEQTATVVNNAGTELPSTGGMGTTVFYIVGAILALGAGVILVARRRMNNF